MHVRAAAYSCAAELGQDLPLRDAHARAHQQLGVVRVHRDQSTAVDDNNDVPVAAHLVAAVCDNAGRDRANVRPMFAADVYGKMITRIARAKSAHKPAACDRKLERPWQAVAAGCHFDLATDLAGQQFACEGNGPKSKASRKCLCFFRGRRCLGGSLGRSTVAMSGAISLRSPSGARSACGNHQQQAQSGEGADDGTHGTKSCNIWPMIPIALTIAGSDPSGGAGIQADLKTFFRHEVYGASAITLLTVQNTRGVTAVELMSETLVRDQIEAVLTDLSVRAIKTGALGSDVLVRAVAHALEAFDGHVVVDPVMISKHGTPLLDDGAVQAFVDHLMARATLVTPNVHEAERLAGVAIRCKDDMETAARILIAKGARSVLLKGGHLDGEESADVLVSGGEVNWFSAPRVASIHTHGTGCSLSAAITARLARGESLLSAVGEAKRWLTQAIESAEAIGGGISPVNHFAVPG